MAFGSAAPTAAVPDTLVVGVVGATDVSDGAVESEPPPHALSAAAAIAASRSLVFMNRIPPVDFRKRETCMTVFALRFSEMENPCASFI
jgi:hypothetical protein